MSGFLLKNEDNTDIINFPYNPVDYTPIPKTKVLKIQTTSIPSIDDSFNKIPAETQTLNFGCNQSGAELTAVFEGITLNDIDALEVKKRAGARQIFHNEKTNRDYTVSLDDFTPTELERGSELYRVSLLMTVLE